MKKWTRILPIIRRRSRERSPQKQGRQLAATGMLARQTRERCPMHSKTKVKIPFPNLECTAPFSVTRERTISPIIFIYPMSILIWSCNDATSRSFLHAIKDHIHTCILVLLGLLQTRVSGTQANAICRKLGFDHWVRVEAFGSSGGIWILWKETFRIDILQTHSQFIHQKVSIQGTNPWILSVVYGNPIPSLRKGLWQDLNGAQLQCSEPC